MKFKQCPKGPTINTRTKINGVRLGNEIDNREGAINSKRPMPIKIEM